MIFFSILNFSLMGFIRHQLFMLVQGNGFGFPGELFGSYTLHEQERREAGRPWMEPPGTHCAQRPQASHTGPFILCHMHAPEAGHRMSLARSGLVQPLARGQAVVIS